MFRKYNKKILTVTLAVVMMVGLLGPGAFLILQSFTAPNPPDQNAQIVDGFDNAENFISTTTTNTSISLTTTTKK